ATSPGCRAPATSSSSTTPPASGSAATGRLAPWSRPGSAPLPIGAAKASPSTWSSSGSPPGLQPRQRDSVPLLTTAVVTSMMTTNVVKDGDDRRMRTKGIGDQELALLQYVTGQGEATVGAAAEGFGAPRGLARSTVLTMMERLRAKGYLARRPVDGVFRY